MQRLFIPFVLQAFAWSKMKLRCVSRVMKVPDLQQDDSCLFPGYFALVKSNMETFF